MLDAVISGRLVSGGFCIFPSLYCVLYYSDNDFKMQGKLPLAVESVQPSTFLT